MTLNEVLEKLDKMFISRYGKKIADLNKNVYPTPKNDKGNYEVPVVLVGKGGGTICVISNNDTIKLNPPAVVSLEHRNMKPQMIIYRLSIPYSECEIAARTEEYFNYLFDEIVQKAIANYKVTVGDENKVRFGEIYITAERQGKERKIFQQLEDTSLELKFYGNWASSEEAYD